MTEHVTKTAPARRRHSVGDGGAPISYDRLRRRQRTALVRVLTYIHRVLYNNNTIIIGTHRRSDCKVEKN